MSDVAALSRAARRLRLVPVRASRGAAEADNQYDQLTWAALKIHPIWTMPQHAR